MIKVKLSDRDAREIDAMVETSFWSLEGKPMSAEAFIRQLFGDVPSFFSSEEELRTLWSKPSTRKELLTALEEKGYTNAYLEDLRKLVHGEDSDLLDVLNYVAYHKEFVPRRERAEEAKLRLGDYDPQQQAFLRFVLEQYVREGVRELSDAKLPDLLALRYEATADAQRTLGEMDTIRETFRGFQAHLYRGRPDQNRGLFL